MIALILLYWHNIQVSFYELFVASYLLVNIIVDRGLESGLANLTTVLNILLMGCFPVFYNSDEIFIHSLALLSFVTQYWLN